MVAYDIIRDLLRTGLELVDDEVVEQFRFIDDRHVAATIGTKGGAVCGPVLYYRVTGDDAVEIFDHDGRLWFRWEQLHRDGGTLHLLSGGMPRVFSILRGRG